MGQTRQIVGPVLLWLLVAATIGALSTVPSWSAELSEAMAVEPWVGVGQIVSPIVMIVLTIFYLIMLVRTRMTQEYLAFVRLLFGAGTVIALTVISFVLRNSFGEPRPCHMVELGGNCPAVESFAYPSSFAVTAFAVAVGLVYAVPWTSYLVFPLAILEGIASILAGHQYPHDVLVGAVLGGIGAIGLLYMFIKIQARIAANMAATAQINGTAE